MKQETQLKDKYGTETGFSVPEDYFEQLNAKILRELPPYPEAPRVVEMTRWQRLKPYVYLAAMFCGIWLMMKVFHNVADTGRLSLDNPPEALVHLFEEGNDDYISIYDEEPEYILEEEVSENYDSIDEFERDFGYELKPEYSYISPMNSEIDYSRNV